MVRRGVGVPGAGRAASEANQVLADVADLSYRALFIGAPHEGRSPLYAACHYWLNEARQPSP